MVQRLTQCDGAEDDGPREEHGEYALRKAELFDRLLDATQNRVELCGHQACIRMISLNASTARLRTVAVSSIATADLLAAIV